MIVDYISDVHLDHWIKSTNPQHPNFDNKMLELINIITPSGQHTTGDVLVIAGDIGHYNQQALFFLIELKKIYGTNIIVTYGNHDMYMLSNAIVSKYKAKSMNRVQDFKEIVQSLDLHFLDGNVVEIDGVKFGGSCSWYNLPTSADVDLWKKVMNDSRKIYDGYAVQPYGMYQNYSQPSTNWDTQQFYMDEYSKLHQVALSGCDVLVTHISLTIPPNEIMNPKYIGDKDNIFYYTDNIELVKLSGAKVHIHGHTHQVWEYNQEGIKVVCNPLGYPSDNTYCEIKQIKI